MGLHLLRCVSPEMAHLYGPAARKAKNDDPEMIGLALLYPAREWNCCVPGHHGYPRALDLIRVSAPKAIWAT